MRPISAIEKAKAIFQEHQGVMRTSQAIRMGIAPRTLYAMRDAGTILQEGRGLYRLAGTSAGSYTDLIHVSLRAPKGVICLISALAFHELTTQIPHYVYLALPQSSEKPRIEYPPLRIFWLSAGPFMAGIEEHVLDGIPVRIYSLEKTVVDCFKFRNKIGLDVALDALKECLRSRRGQVDVLEKYARIDHVEKVIHPYLEALV